MDTGWERQQACAKRGPEVTSLRMTLPKGWGGERGTLVPELVVQFLTLRGCAAPPEGAVPQESVASMGAARQGLSPVPCFASVGLTRLRVCSRGLGQPAMLPRPGKPWLPCLGLRKAKCVGVCVCCLAGRIRTDLPPPTLLQFKAPEGHRVP